MSDIRERVRDIGESAPAVPMPAITERAGEIRRSDQRRARLLYGALGAVLMASVGLVALNPLGDRSTTLDTDVAQEAPALPDSAPLDPTPPDPTTTASVVPAPAPSRSPMVISPPSETEFSMLDPGVPDGDFPIIDGGPEVDYDIWVVQPGDNLSDIAEAVYGDPLLFGPIAEANGLTGEAPTLGSTLIIPELPVVGTSPSPSSTQSWVDPLDPTGLETETYEVQPGDSLAGIAQALYGNSLFFHVLRDANDVSDANPLMVGQRLIVPPAEITHVLRPEETLGTLAEQYYGDRVGVDLILRTNDLASGSDFRPGREIRIPRHPQLPPPELVEVEMDDGIRGVIDTAIANGHEIDRAISSSSTELLGGGRLRVTLVASPIGQSPTGHIDQAIAYGAFPLDSADGLMAFDRTSDQGSILFPIGNEYLMQLDSPDQSANLREMIPALFSVIEQVRDGLS